MSILTGRRHNELSDEVIRWFHPQSCLAAKIEAGITFAVVGFGTCLRIVTKFELIFSVQHRIMIILAGLLLFTVFIVLECSEFWEEEKRERRRAQARGGRDEEAISMQDGYHEYRL